MQKYALYKNDNGASTKTRKALAPDHATRLFCGNESNRNAWSICYVRYFAAAELRHLRNCLY